MTRPLRLEVANGVYHVTARGNERRAIYRDNADRERFLELLERTLTRFAWRWLGYCLMSNHYHLLVRTPQANLSRGMRDLNGMYAQWFNRRHGRDGHLFQGRYGAILVETDQHLLTALAYVVRNPVRAGLCASPRDWRWSSHLAVIGERPPDFLAVDEVLSHFGSDRRTARKSYRGLTEDRGTEEPILEADGVIAGSDDFARHHLVGTSDSPDIPAAHTRPPVPPLEEILLATATTDAVAAAYKSGYSMGAISRYLGVHPSTISRRLSRNRAQIKT